MCKTCQWEKALEALNEMTEETDTYGWASKTLYGIKEWVEDNEHVTERQEQAIENIREAGLKEKED
jgi:hypothetical protein